MVTTNNDPTVTNTDINGDGNTDYFLSFSLSFQTLVDRTLEVSGLNIDQTTPMSFVMATASQDNSLNQDINGITNGINSTLTWSELGAISEITSVPEPGTLTLLGAGLTLSFGIARRRHKSRS